MQPDGRALTIAGSDNSGGAGIQADLKTFTAFGVYGMSAITAVTAQNTLGVQRFEMATETLIAAQIDSVVTDIGLDAAKTGMLGTAAVVRLVAEKVREHGISRLVVDPVMLAKSGDALLVPEAQMAVRTALLPVALVVTPNLPEAEALTGRRVDNLETMRLAARDLHRMGARWVVVKGGHLGGGAEAVDIVFDGQSFTEMRAPRRATVHTHGTGCTFSAAVTAGLAKGRDPLAAIQQAKAYISRAIETAPGLGGGHGPTNHLVDVSSGW